MTSLVLILLIISTLITIALEVFINTKIKNSQLSKVFSMNLLCILIWNVALIFQFILADRLNIPPIYFDYVAYIGICLLPVSVYFTGVIFENTRLKFEKKYLLFLVIPIISLLVLWTNDYHHLFYKVYSINIDNCVYGNYMTVHTVYTYSLLALGVYHLLKFSIKNSGFFSKQSLLVALGISIPVILNILGAVKIIPMTIYITPITFSMTMLCCALAVFKFKFIGTVPIALQRIVDRISDSYMVLDFNNIITDFNKTFLTTFGLTDNEVRNKDLFELIGKYGNFGMEKVLLKDTIYSVRGNLNTVQIPIEVKQINKFFNMEINVIESKKQYIGTLILFKDTTQHIEDMRKIKENQDMLIERERLASLGQMIGGIAHNLKTPIMSISGASEGLNDLITEYEQSIADPEVTVEDHHDIAKDMREWVSKIKSYTEYMSDVITAVKGQAVNMSEQEADSFTVEELTKRINILMKHELKSAIVYLDTKIECEPTTEIFGNINSLVQVINNMISNSIQAYNGEPEKRIELIVKKDKNIVITVRDFGPGIPEIVKEKLFKEMITTKGKNGTGLGLYMSYSNIRAHFNGNMEIDPDVKDGTAINIIIPVKK